jgi:hypothetical protein
MVQNVKTNILRIRNMTTKNSEEKIKLINRVMETMYDSTESFEEVGCQLSYLVWSISSGNVFQGEDGSANSFVQLLLRSFSPADAVWEYVELPNHDG